VVDGAEVRHPWLHGIGAFALHATLLGWLTWPLLATATTHLASTNPVCAFDAELVGWALAHQSWALLTNPFEYFHGGIYHPAPNALLYGEAGFGAVPYFLPVFWATGNPTLALNVTWLLSLVLTATIAHLVVIRWTGSFAGGAVAGGVILTSPWVIWAWVPCAPNYAVLQYLPLIVYLAAPRQQGWRRILALSALVALQGLTSVYVATVTLLLLGVLTLWRLVRPQTRSTGWRLVGAVGLAALVLVGVYANHLRVVRDNPDLRSQSYWAPRWANARQTRLPFALQRLDQPAGVPNVVVVVVAVGALAGFVGRRWSPTASGAWAHATFWFLAGTYFSFTPVVRWAGSEYSLPHALPPLSYLYDVVRISSRLGVAALIGFALLSGVAVGEMRSLIAGPARDGRRRVLATVACATLAVLVLAVTYQRLATLYRLTTTTGSYPLRQAIAADDPGIEILPAGSDGPLLEVPVAPGPRPHADAMYRSIYHGRPLVNGYDGYHPKEFRHRMALACRLPRPSALAQLRRETGVRLILVDTEALSEAYARSGKPPYVCRPPRGMSRAQAARQTIQAWRDATTSDRSDLRLLARRGPLALFAVGP